MITVWDAPTPFTILPDATTPAYRLDLNTVLGNGDAYLLARDGCRVDRPLRVTSDNIPQGDGQILHRRFTEGYSVTLKIDLWHSISDTMEEGSLAPACDEDLVRMTDTLMGIVNATLNAEDARLLWTPPGYAGRMLRNIRWREYPAQDPESAGVALTVTFDTQFPYEISQDETNPALGGTVTNDGNTNYYPVLHIDGPSSAFIVANDTLGFGIVYDSARPGGIALGGGDYAEINTFNNTIVLNGDVQDLDAGVDPLLSTFFWLLPGDNETEISGASGYVLNNSAWA